MSTPNPLGRYLAARDLSCAAFARSIGAHPAQISRLVTGERGASGVLALSIEQATGGAVKVADVVRPRKPRRRHGRKVARSAA